MGIDGSLIALEIVAPHLVEQLGPRAGLAGMRGQVGQQVELPRPQAKRRPVQCSTAPAQVDLQPPDQQQPRGERAAAPRPPAPPFLEARRA